ncbi:hypothetical protein [Actinoplanes awajinensis]|uniref:Uncharacterized protein n=1 Tax=Actinoplanes awajinensis subsp. mycoplanecinus TaxID=135947 RepID=A0A101JQ01_9ACTN|nr:hypothetical protein [Actinoplanes awajinensis]KUL30818.1 hypothetical protein ADL15_22890 [Actinoplanes awajinensis subsp. mycoplanecinus]
MDWYSVRAVFAFGFGDGPGRTTYEERVTLWRADDLVAAIALAEADAADYAGGLDDCVFTGLLQAYHLYDEPGAGAEVFSLMRTSALAPDDYLSAFFDTGDERQGHVG